MPAVSKPWGNAVRSMLRWTFGLGCMGTFDAFYRADDASRMVR